jgi:DNA-binding NarL/FixJ family response regulator
MQFWPEVFPGLLFMAREQPGEVPTLRVFLVDDEPVVRRGLRLLLELRDEISVCGEAASEAAAVEGIAKTRPHLAVVDLSLESGDGLTLIKRLRDFSPTLKILVFSMHDHAEMALAAFVAGAQGYIVKDDGTENVVAAIQTIMAGGSFLSGRISDKAPDLLSRCRLPSRG